MNAASTPLNCPCDGGFFARVFAYDAPPKGEVSFEFSASVSYRREVLKCGLCGHFISTHDMDTSALYASDYVSSNYRDDDGIRRSFERVIALDPDLSDNAGRVRRVLAFATQRFTATGRSPSVLDVGSGLCVFLYGMKAGGWDCTALDPDARSARHAREGVGVTAVCDDFMAARDLGRFDVVTLNKVLEHVEDPVAMLAKAASHLNPGGFVYFEVPDGEAAVADGPDREEFYIDHPHIFSQASLGLMSVRAGLSVRVSERLREPSGKYTLWAFVAPEDRPPTESA